ncbi:MAG: hypothetical protein R2867_39850 [Caldilineaceae bacterium]
MGDVGCRQRGMSIDIGQFCCTGCGGTGSDIFICDLLAGGPNATSCRYQMYWQGAASGFNRIIDGFAIHGDLPLFAPAGQTVTSAAALDADALVDSDIDDDPLTGDVESDDVVSEKMEALTQTVFLPLINR